MAFCLLLQLVAAVTGAFLLLFVCPLSLSFSQKLNNPRCFLLVLTEQRRPPTLSVHALQNLPSFKTATHRIAAWRTPSDQKSLTPATKVLYDLGHDDDGEKWAGGKLQHVLKETGAEGVVVVARWYGGQNIGPIRFTHIENCAKQAIQNWKVVEAEAQRERSAKQLKLEEQAKREKLEENLRERDLNIYVLRRLLADKNARIQGNGGEEAPPVTPQKPLPDYSTMSIETLQRVDRARDATIAYVLKQIDKADEQLKIKAEPAKEPPPPRSQPDRLRVHRQD